MVSCITFGFTAYKQPFYIFKSKRLTFLNRFSKGQQKTTCFAIHDIWLFSLCFRYLHVFKRQLLCHVNVHLVMGVMFLLHKACISYASFCFITFVLTTVVLTGPRHIDTSVNILKRNTHHGVTERIQHATCKYSHLVSYIFFYINLLLIGLLIKKKKKKTVTQCSKKIIPNTWKQQCFYPVKDFEPKFLPWP